MGGGGVQASLPAQTPTGCMGGSQTGVPVLNTRLFGDMANGHIPDCHGSLHLLSV